MARSYHFLLTFLPSLPELGGRCGITLAELRELTADDAVVGRAIDALLLETDLLSRESALAGETDLPAPAVLSAEQARGELPLPDYLAAEGTGRRIPVDAMWEAYYEHVAAEARAIRCGFLRQWVGFEVALRNALVAERARILDLEPADYAVAEALGETDANLGDMVTAFTAATDPLKGQRVLDEARYAWALERSEYFSFSLDEVVAYARRLMLAVRWERLAEETRQPGPNEAA